MIDVIGVGGGVGAITTAGASEVYGLIATVNVVEPKITLGTGDTCTLAATLYIKDAPTEGATNAALYVAAGASYFGGAVTASSTLTAADTVGLASTKKLYFDGVAMSGDTYIVESSANVLDLYAGAAKQLSLTAATATIAGNLLVSGSGPMAIGAGTLTSVALRIATSYTATGGLFCDGVRVATTLTMNAANTQASHLSVGPGATIITPGTGITVALASSVYLVNPSVTVNGADTVTAAATLYIKDPPTAGSSNYALWVDGGIARLDGDVDARGTLTVTGGFGCNSKTAQTAYASGGALAAYAAGANGLSSGAEMSALHALVVKLRAALVANGIMS